MMPVSRYFEQNQVRMGRSTENLKHMVSKNASTWNCRDKPKSSPGNNRTGEAEINTFEILNGKESAVPGNLGMVSAVP